MATSLTPTTSGKKRETNDKMSRKKISKRPKYAIFRIYIARAMG